MVDGQRVNKALMVQYPSEPLPVNLAFGHVASMPFAFEEWQEWEIRGGDVISKELFAVMLQRKQDLEEKHGLRTGRRASSSFTTGTPRPPPPNNSRVHANTTTSLVDGEKGVQMEEEEDNLLLQ